MLLNFCSHPTKFGFFLLIRTQVKKTNGDIEISIKVSRPSQECAPLHLGPPQGLKLVIGMFADCEFFIGDREEESRIPGVRPSKKI